MAVAIATTAFIAGKHATLLQMSAEVRSANPEWMFGAVAAEFVGVWLVATKYRCIFGRLGHRLSGFFLIRLQLERAAIGTISPIGSAPAYYVYVRGLQRRGVPMNDALLAASLSGIAGIVPFVVGILFTALHFSSPTLFAGLLAGIGLFGAFVVFGVSAFKHSTLPEQWFRRAPKRARVFIEQAQGHGLNPRDLTLPITFALLGRLLGIVTLYLCLRAVGQETSVVTPIVVSVIGSLASRLMPIFRGLGVVEAAMAGSLVQVGIPAAPALGATLLYRLTSLWMPLILGLLVQLIAAGMVRASRTKTDPEPVAIPATAATRVTERQWRNSVTPLG